MRSFRKLFIFFLLSLSLLFFTPKVVDINPAIFAQTTEGKLEELRSEIEEYEREIERLRNQANTLSNQIAQLDAQIRLTGLKIERIEEKILLLGGRIGELEMSLQALTSAFSSRAAETYKMARLGEPLLLLISSPDLTNAVSRFHYLQRIQEADRDLLVRLQEAQTTYKEEKVEQEELHEQLEEEKAALDAQKVAKSNLLTLTRNDEKKYQQLLAAARAEFEAIQAIIAGRGQETEAGPVSEGVRIASVISGASACSTGAHLHFEVAKNGANVNPATLLSSKSVIWHNAPDGQFGFSGSWPWPINEPIRITQGYGMTYYASVLKYYGGAPHSGIDMVNEGDYTVKAVKPGTLYRGAIACGGGTLRYVHVEQGDGYNTYYLHVNY